MGSLQGFCMLPGLDDASYAVNSGFQHSMLLRCRPFLEKAIALHQVHLLELTKAAVPTSQNCSDDGELPDEGSSDSDAIYKWDHVFCIADMGSSSGPNCLTNMQFVVDTIRNCNPSGQCRQVQCFFCDLPSNDFNTLLQILHAQYPRLHHQQEQESGCSAAAVAGTIYGRLFPPSSLHFVFSSSALHWISQVPQEVTTPGTPEWNKGKILVDGTNEATKRAYAHQWHQDLVLFLKCRMLELVQGGMMFLMIPFVSPNSVPQKPTCFRSLERSWQQLVDEGFMEEIELDSFNVPMYRPNLEEIKSAANSVSELTMQSLEVLEEHIEGNYWGRWSHDLTDCAKRLENFYRSFIQSLIEKHVGTIKCEAIFNRFTKVIEESLREQLAQHSSWTKPPSSYAIIQLIKNI